MVVVRYWSINRLDRLYNLAELEAEEFLDEKSKRIEDSPVETPRPKLALEAPPDYNSSTSKSIIKPPIISLGELDASMNAIRESPKEMLRVSNEVIDPLLNRWTRLPELQEQAKRGYYPQQSHSNGSSNSPHPHEYYETDEEDSPVSPVDTRIKGYYLEGTTTDWRKPHSSEARRELSRLRKVYSPLQPSVDSDAEDHDIKPHKNKRAPTRHIIDSDEESEPDRDIQRQRRSSDGSRLEKPKSRDSKSDRPQSYTPDTRAYSDKFLASPRGSVSIPMNSRPPLAGPPQMQAQQRPMPTPGQIPNFHHSVSSPLPPPHGQGPPSPNRSPYGSPYTTYNAMNPFPPPPPYSFNFRNQYAPGLLQPQQLPPGISPQQMQASLQQVPRTLPPLTMPRSSDSQYVRPGSRHSSSGKSPRDSRERQGSLDGRDRERDRDRDRDRDSRENKEREKRKKEFKKGATKGILGGVGIATFLEALEGLSI
jgi:hypothetical protein